MFDLIILNLFCQSLAGISILILLFRLIKFLLCTILYVMWCFFLIFYCGSIFIICIDTIYLNSFHWTYLNCWCCCYFCILCVNTFSILFLFQDICRIILSSVSLWIYGDSYLKVYLRLYLFLTVSLVSLVSHCFSCFSHREASREANHCVLLLQDLSTHMHLITNG